MKNTLEAKIFFKIDKKIVRNTKSFIYRGERYPFDFELLKQNSNYFYNNRQFLENVDNINLINKDEEDLIEISNEAIDNFIKCCQEESIAIDISNVIPLQFLSYKYDVPQLIKITTKFISENSQELAIKSLLFKSQFHKDDNNSIFLDSSNEESLISSNLSKYVNDEHLLNLPIPVLDRIDRRFSEKNEIKPNDEIIDFLFKCLDKHGKEASILFSFVNFEHQSIDFINRLITNYSDIFDFNMINSTLLKTTSQLTSELAKLKIEFSNALIQMKNLFEEQKRELEIYQQDKLIKKKMMI